MSGSAEKRQAGDLLQALQGQLSDTRQELEQVRCQLAEYETLLGELPGIFERKFQQRKQLFELQQQLLAKENASLREIVQASGRQTAPPPPPAALKPAGSATAPLPQTPRSTAALLHPRAWTMAAKGVAVVFGCVVLGAAVAAMRPNRPTPIAAGPIAAATAPIPITPAQLPARILPAPPQPAPSAAVKPGPNLLVLNSSAPNWVEVRTLAGQRVYEGLLNGEKTLPLGQGLQVLAGRPDLLTVQQGAGRPKRLGRINELAWISFRPSAPPASKRPTVSP